MNGVAHSDDDAEEPGRAGVPAVETAEEGDEPPPPSTSAPPEVLAETSRLLEARAARRSKPEKLKGVTADSLKTVLAQSLRSGDQALLEKCLEVGDAGVVATTVAQIGSQDSVKLLEALVGRLRRTPVRAQQLNHWLRALLKAHTAHLVTAPSAQQGLRQLHQLIERRVAIYRQMSALSGRLELLVSLDRARRGGGGLVAGGPLVVFHDGAEDAAEEGGSGSEEEVSDMAEESEEDEFED